MRGAGRSLLVKHGPGRHAALVVRAGQKPTVTPRTSTPQKRASQSVVKQSAPVPADSKPSQPRRSPSPVHSKPRNEHSTRPLTRASPGTKGSADQASQNPDSLGKLQWLPDHLSYQVLPYENKGTQLERTLEKCLQYYKHNKLKVLVFVGNGIKLENIKDRIFGIQVIHSRLAPTKKADLVRRFNSGKLPSLVVNDATALGLEFEDVDVVMQIGSLPASPSQYFYRAGCCGCMGRPGTVVSLIPAERLAEFYGMMKRMHLEPTEMKLLVYPPKAIGRPVPPDLVPVTETEGDAS